MALNKNTLLGLLLFSGQNFNIKSKKCKSAEGQEKGPELLVENLKIAPCTDHFSRVLSKPAFTHAEQDTDSTDGSEFHRYFLFAGFPSEFCICPEAFQPENNDPCKSYPSVRSV